MTSCCIKFANIQWIYFTIWEKGKEELSPLQYHFKSLHIISRHYKKSLLRSQIYHGYEELSTDTNYPIWRKQKLPYMKKTRKKKQVCGAACFMAAEIKFSEDVQPSMGLGLCIAYKALGRNGLQFGMLMYPDGLHSAFMDAYGYCCWSVCPSICPFVRLRHFQVAVHLQRRAVVIIGRWLLPSLVDTGDICCHYWQHILVNSDLLKITLSISHGTYNFQIYNLYPTCLRWWNYCVNYFWHWP